MNVYASVSTKYIGRMYIIGDDNHHAHDVFGPNLIIYKIVIYTIFVRKNRPIVYF